ncbi:unnamed protein product [Paramecium pentaurelia]|uniref:Uncharacterized protein n=1 Tax=Paramecium pentaurelia TaxID=43138 RepID=A0A8S1U0I0_9CILI|nr:unnamed protein product [Paramecium pentaurelia]
MNPNKPLFLGQNHRSYLLQPQEVQPRSYSVQIQNNRYSIENDLKHSHLAQSHLEHQERLQQFMAAQNQQLKQQLIEIENRQLKLQNELLSQQVQKIQFDLENTLKLISKKKKNPSIQQNLAKLSQSSNFSSKYQKQQSLSIASSDTKEEETQRFNDKNTSKNEAIEFQISENFENLNHKQFNNGNRQSYKIQKSQRRKKRLKKYVIVVLACIRLLWKQRIKIKENRLKLKKIKEKFEIAKQKLLAIPEENIRNLLSTWVNDLLEEIIQILNSEQFYAHCDTPNYNANKEENIVYRQELIIKLTQNFFDRLEYMTRDNILPSLIIDLMYLSLFYSQNPKVSLFVAKRTNFYVKNTIKLSNQQEMLIISEYIFFRLIIQYMLKIFNQLKYKNDTHEKLCKFFVTIIASFIQILYIDFFEDMKFVKQINVQLYQRKIVLDEKLKAYLLEDDKIDEGENLILGLHDRSQFEQLFQQQMDWITQMGKTFYQILLNLHNQI